MGFLDWLGSSPPSAGDWVIERKGKYWDGHKFVADKTKAATFASTRSAWDYVDSTFQEATAEDCGLVR